MNAETIRSEFSELCEKLRRNDPGTTVVVCHAHSGIALNDDMAFHLGEALIGNQHVTHLSVSLSNLSTTHGNYHPLLHFIENCESLRCVGLDGAQRTIVSHVFLHSVARNRGIQKVYLLYMVLGADSMSLLLRSATSMHTLALLMCHLEASNGFEIHDVATDLSAHSMLKTLTVDCAFGVFLALHDGIAAHESLHELFVVGNLNIHGDVIQAIRTILEFPNSALHHLLLNSFHFRNDVSFAPMVQSIQAHRTLAKLAFAMCTFDFRSERELMSIYQSGTSHVQALTFQQSLVVDSHDALTNSMRHCLGLHELNFVDYSGDDALNFSIVLELLKAETPVKRCKLSMIGDATCRNLIQVLPHARRLKELTLGIDTGISLPNESLLCSFEKNSSIVKIVIEGYLNYFNAHNMARIRFYTTRNEQLPRLLAAGISEVPLSLRPRLLCVAKQCHSGPALIFQSLIGLRDSVGQGKEKVNLKHRCIT